MGGGSLLPTTTTTREISHDFGGGGLLSVSSTPTTCEIEHLGSILWVVDFLLPPPATLSTLAQFCGWWTPSAPTTCEIEGVGSILGWLTPFFHHLQNKCPSSISGVADSPATLTRSHPEIYFFYHVLVVDSTVLILVLESLVQSGLLPVFGKSETETCL